ncbi:MAG: molybdenum cofactor guanylyltransferase [Nitrospinae bacterium]|nr:molybdenum cofactor guanylyltransferase [Nitrospinota bacterium]
MTVSPQIPIAILAGGKSVRMGRDKAFVEVEGVPMIERVIAAARQCSANVIIIANEPEKYQKSGLPVHTDKVKGMGPLSGLVTAFEATGAGAVMMIACDMPYISPAMIRHILSRYLKGCGAVIPYAFGREQGLCAIYERRLLEKFTERIGRGDIQFNEFRMNIEKVNISETELKAVEGDLRSFININDEEELRKGGR